jgi:hypothetical protein
MVNSRKGNYGGKEPFWRADFWLPPDKKEWRAVLGADSIRQGLQVPENFFEH